ncbi:MAG: hypothetical protein GF418_05005 [Chitinivibrionales bacterium]|nr:hypothetical protein [Chitinivibrionales bacterium]MBD3394968.1 hypothetical protein [Chitinivibrionales bacterium]
MHRPACRRHIACFPAAVLAALCTWSALANESELPEQLSSSIRRAGQLGHTSLWTGATPDSVYGVAASARIGYLDLFHQKLQLSDGSIRETHVESPQSRLAWHLGAPSWAVDMAMHADGYHAVYKDGFHERAFRVEQTVRTVDFTLWKHGRDISAGLHLGKALGSRLREISDTAGLTPLQPASFAGHNPTVNYGLLLKASRRQWTIRLHALRRLTHASVLRITQQAGGQFRTLPLAVATRDFSAGIGRSWPAVTAEIMGSLLFSRSSRIIESDSSLPCDGDALTKSITTRGDLRLGRISGQWNVWYRTSGGYLAGYSDGFNYLLVDSAVARTTGGIATALLPLKIKGGVFGEWCRAEAPAGHAHMAPFVSWTAVDQVRYRIRSAHVRGYEGGIFASRAIDIGSHNRLAPELSFSRVKATCSFRRQEEDILTWDASPDNDTLRVPFGVRGYMLAALLSHTVSFGRFRVNARVRQRIPFVEDTRNLAKDDPAFGAQTRFRYGGTEYYLMVAYALTAE